ncbi:Tripartite ATP-independent transporter, DctQ component [Tranquillimonas rosea]|uniref:TRAP transporter small permease protein n=1 Tax=Tranquillimonas rosea TaxID=641238 RepID=A0A1H9SIP6_9RHOB|nr:TRAP transporter small permease subunit [Tranquillimonas rosea]SER84525.1 Tripartite ATP-independent transporter, DctQ component [Tranquillimonas rosea]
MAALALLRRVERTLLVTIFLTMVGLFFFSVLAREFGGSFASRVAWIEEAVRLLNIFLVFLGLGLALERGLHVGIDTFRDRLPDRLRRPLLKVVDLCGVLFSAYLVWLGVGLVRFVLMTGQRSPTLELPMGWIYAAPVAGFALLGLRFALSLFGVIDRFQPAEPLVGEAQ